jgi:hypothetical protein
MLKQVAIEQLVHVIGGLQVLRVLCVRIRVRIQSTQFDVQHIDQLIALIHTHALGFEPLLMVQALHPIALHKKQTTI